LHLPHIIEIYMSVWRQKHYDKNNNVSFECLVIYIVTSITAHYVNHIGGVIIIMLSSSPVDHGFKTWLNQTKDSDLTVAQTHDPPHSRQAN
jgi:hypothetical protein